MAEFSVVPLQEIAQAARWDAKYYRPLYRQGVDMLANWPCQPLSKLTDITDGNHLSMSERFTSSGIRYLRGKDLSDFFISDDDPVYISQEDYEDLERSQMTKGDVLVGIVGTLGTVGLVTSKYDQVTGNCKLAILRSKEMVPEFLAIYLSCTIGQHQLLRQARGAVQAGIILPDLRSLPIPLVPGPIQRQVGALVRVAFQKHLNAGNLYPEAEQELLERMDWAAFQATKPELFFVERTAVLDNAGRVDAEHFQPKYLRLREKLQKLGAARIGDFCPPPNRGVQPLFVPGGEVLVFASKATRPQGVAPDDEARASHAFWEDAANEKARVVAGDVLLNSTGVGTLGRASFYLDDTPAIADTHVTILRPDDGACLPAYLSLFLNSPAGIAQNEMFQTGSSGQLEIYPQHIQEILIFTPRNKNGSVDLAWQKKLADKVVGASTAKQQAQAKLAEAKRLVEDTIASGAKS